jgi:hypothetical protein
MKFKRNKITFAIWPGDENYELEKKLKPDGSGTESERKLISLGGSSKFVSTKRKIGELDKDEASAPVQPVVKRPSSMMNRYFSIENVETVSTAAEQPQKAATPLVQQPSKEIKLDNPQRLDFILKKLYKVRNLPGSEETATPVTAESVVKEKEATDHDSDDSAPPSPTPDPVNPLSDSTSKQYRPDRKHSFGEDFIPLAKTPSPEPCVEDEDSEEMKDKLQIAEALAPSLSPKAELDRSAYSGPYDLASINRARRYIIDDFRNSYIDRVTEILKMKMNIKSKFDTDQRLWRRIKQATYHAQRSLQERKDSFEKCLSAGGPVAGSSSSRRQVSVSAAAAFKFNSHKHFMDEDLVDRGERKIDCIELSSDDNEDDDLEAY